MFLQSLYIIYHISNNTYYMYLNGITCANKWGLCQWDTDDAPACISYKVLL